MFYGRDEAVIHGGSLLLFGSSPPVIVSLLQNTLLCLWWQLFWAMAMRVLEFYTGIGGLRYSLQESGVEGVVLEAFDINQVANDVYEHSFGHRSSQRNIQRLTARHWMHIK